MAIEGLELALFNYSSLSLRSPVQGNALLSGNTHSRLGDALYYMNIEGLVMGFEDPIMGIED